MVALRLGEFADPAATTRLIGQTNPVVVALPTYRSRMDCLECLTTWLPARPLSRMPPREREHGHFGGMATTCRPASITGNLHGNYAAAAAAVAEMADATTALGLPLLTRGLLIQLGSNWMMGEVEARSIITPGRRPMSSARAQVKYLIADCVASALSAR